jgi:dipeptidyl aminopeptidase/acylaminoacyl peptidase
MPRRISEEPVGIVDAFVTPAGDGVIWFSDPSGAEAGRYVVAPFGGGEPRPLLRGVPEGWSAGLARGRTRVAAAIATAEGFAVYAALDGAGASPLYTHPEYAGLAGTEGAGSDRASLSADETLLCIAHAEHGDIVRTALRVLDVRTGAAVGDQYDGPGLGLDAAAWSPLPGDQRLVLVHEREGVRRPAIWDLGTGERHDVALDVDAEVEPVDWWPDATALLLVATHDGRDRLLRLELGSGVLTEIPVRDGTISGAAVRPDGTVWYRVASGGEPPRVLAEDGTEVVAPPERSPGGRPYASWHFVNPAGDRVHGFHALPEGEPPFPIVMWVHGGPTWLYADDWNPDVQALVDAGYAVAMVNYRGSTGYGTAWRDHLVGNIGFPELEDVLAGLDDLVARGLADRERAAIGGYSWGGYITLLMLGVHPERFTAGVAGVPVGDYAECYRELSPPLQAYDRYLLGGSLEEKIDLVRERSPITYVDRVRAPVLCLIAQNDTRCPPRQAHLYVDALRARGGEVEVYTSGVGHSPYVVDEDVRQTRTILDFLQRTLR